MCAMHAVQCNVQNYYVQNAHLQITVTVLLIYTKRKKLNAIERMCIRTIHYSKFLYEIYSECIIFPLTVNIEFDLQKSFATLKFLLHRSNMNYIKLISGNHTLEFALFG